MKNMTNQRKLTPEIKAFILSQPNRSSYALKEAIESEFDISISYNSVCKYRRRIRKIEAEYLINSGNKDLDLEKMIAEINKFDDSILKRYWESTLACALVTYLKDRKLNEKIRK